MSEIKKLRLKLNMTQQEVAEYLGISRRSYQSYESGDNNNSLKFQYIKEKMEEYISDENKRILSFEEIKSACENVFSNYDIEYCYLFGSYAKNKAKESSDIDLLISTKVTGLKYYGIVEELRQKLNKKIDLIEVKQLEKNIDLLNEILKDGIKIYG